MKKGLLWISVTIGVIIIFQICYGLAVLQPTNINWLMSARHDWGTHYLGWAFYKNEPWHFPLGQVFGYNYPVGTNVGFTDSIPLMAIFFKLFAPFLPGDFQYFGWWLLSCHLLVAYFTILLFRIFKVSTLITFAAAIFIAANPVLIHRGMHPALCAQWLLIACIYFYFLDPALTPTRKILFYQFIVLILSALINPYLCLMVVGFTIATPIKLCFINKVLARKQFFIYLTLSVLSVVLVWYLTGMISFGRKEDLGVGGAYGLYTMNLNALYNAGGFSALTPAYDWVSWHQYEGFMYLGAGILLLIIILFFYRIYSFVSTRINKEINSSDSKYKRDLIPLLILGMLYAVFSITLVISFNSKVILRIPAPAAFIHLEEVFRACGRFFWMPYYLIMMFAIIGIAKIKANPLITTSIIIIALGIQLYDIKILLTFRKLPFGTYTPPMANSEWIKIMSQFDEVIFYPAFETPNIRAMDYQDFSYLALKAGKPVNLAYVARGDSHAARQFNDSLNRMVENDSLSPRALYITNSSHLEHFSVAFQNGSARLNMLDSCFYIYSNAVNNRKLDILSNQLNNPFKNLIDSSVAKIQIRTQFVQTTRLPDSAGKFIHYWLQSLNEGQKVISMDGWAFIDTTNNNKGDSIFITLQSGDKSYIVRTKIIPRPDMTSAFKRAYLDDAGFNFIGFTDHVEPGSYQVGMAIKDASGHYFFESKLLRGELPVDKYIKR